MPRIDVTPDELRYLRGLVRNDGETILWGTREWLEWNNFRAKLEDAK